VALGSCVVTGVILAVRDMCVECMHMCIRNLPSARGDISTDRWAVNTGQ